MRALRAVKCPVASRTDHASYVAEFHDMDQVALTRAVVADVCAGSQSATHAMEMLGVSAIPMDVDCFPSGCP